MTPSVWYTPYVWISSLPESVQEAIQSVLPGRLPDIAVIDENGNEDNLLETDMVEEYYIQNVVSF